MARRPKGGGALQPHARLCAVAIAQDDLDVSTGVFQVHLTTEAASSVSLPDIPNDRSVERVVFKLAQRIREEFEEAPEARFTLREASQFWGLDEGMCTLVFARLLAVGFLSKDANERYGRA